jgi:endoglucanase
MTRQSALSVLVVFGTVAAAPSLFAQSSARHNNMVHQEGRTIVDANNRPLRLRGVMAEGWLQWEGDVWGKALLASDSKIRERLNAMVGPEEAQRFSQQIYENYVAEPDIRAMAQLGFNLLRIPVNYRLLEDNGPAWASIDRVLGWCEQYHVYVVIDLHSVPGGQARVPTADPEHTLVWDSAENQKKTVEVWKRIATRYRSRAIIAGYDLINEPAPSSPQLVELYQQIVQAVRAVDPDHMIIIEGGKLASDLSLFSRPLCDNQVYSFHTYETIRDNRAEKLAEFKSVSLAQNVPLWVGEFGANSYEKIASTRQMFDDPANGISGWTYWPWKMAPGKYPGLVMIHETENWSKVIGWTALLLPRPLLKPRPEQALAGMREFAEAVKFQNCSVDEQMKAALLGK